MPPTFVPSWMGRPRKRTPDVRNWRNNCLMPASLSREIQSWETASLVVWQHPRRPSRKSRYSGKAHTFLSPRLGGCFKAYRF